MRNPILHQIIEPGRLAIRLGDLCLHHEVSTVRALANALPKLRGKDLACWCAPLLCHGDVLLELANASAP